MNSDILTFFNDFNELQKDSMFQSYTPIRKGLRFVRLSDRSSFSRNFFLIEIDGKLAAIEILKGRLSESELLSELDKFTQCLSLAA